MNEIFLAAMIYLMEEARPQKLKQIELAKLSGVSASYINDIRKKRTSGSDDAHRRIAAALGYPGRKYEDFLDIGRSKLKGLPVWIEPELRPDELEDAAEEIGSDVPDNGPADDDRFFTRPAEQRYFFHALNHMLRRRNRLTKDDLIKKTRLKESVIDGLLERRGSPSPAMQQKVAAAWNMTLDGFLAVGKRIDEEITLQMGNFYPDNIIQMPPEDDVPAAADDIYGRILNQPPAKKTGPAAALRPLPLLGLAKCGYEGWHMVMPFSVSAAPLTQGPRAFAVIVDGLSMRPEGLGPGMICYCDPDQSPLPGDAVYIGTSRAKGGSLGSIKKYLGAGSEVGLEEGWIKVRGWNDPDKHKRQKSYVIDIPPHQIVIVATVIYVRRRV